MSITIRGMQLAIMLEIKFITKSRVETAMKLEIKPITELEVELIDT